MTPELQAIIERHEDRLKACGDKLMNAERDLSVVLEIAKVQASALRVARSQLVTLGGGHLCESRFLGDEMQRSILAVIDAALGQ